MEHFYNNIEGWFDFQDIYSEMVSNAKNGSHFVELGSWKGKSAAFMAVEIKNSGKDIRFDCVDIWDWTPEYEGYTEKENNTLYEEFVKNVSPVNEFVNPVKGFTHDVCKFYSNQSLDFVFVDASHEYANVKMDIEMWLPKIKTGGVFAGHDYTYCDGVSRAVRECLPFSEIVTRTSSWFYVVNRV